LVTIPKQNLLDMRVEMEHLGEPLSHQLKRLPDEARLPINTLPAKFRQLFYPQ